MAEQIMVPADDSFPAEVVHIANPALRLKVVAYGLSSTQYGAVPVVATYVGEHEGQMWFAGEADVINGVPTLMAVNSYGDKATAMTYAASIWVPA